MNWKDALKKLKQGRGGAGPAKKEEESKGAETASVAPPARGKTPATRDLCIGLDFGTSSTKCVVRLLPSAPAWAVPLGGEGKKQDPYLAPTQLWVALDGTLSLKKKGAGGWAEELKVRLMEAPWAEVTAATGLDVQARPVDLAAGYLALVLRSVFDWFERSVQPVLGAAKPRWSFNLGIPARDYDAAEIKSAFAVAARTAWNLAHGGDPISVARAAELNDQALRGGLKSIGIDEAMIDVVPEVAAGVASYARSPQRQAGPHLFVDVGATTLDTSMFLLVESEDGLKYTFLWADVDSALGAFRLHRHRADEIGRLALARFAAADPLKPIPLTAKDCIPPLAEVEGIDTGFAERCVKKVCSVVYQAKLKAPTEISVRSEGPPGVVQVLRSGGGIRLPLYQEVVRQAGVRVAPGGGLGLIVCPFRIEALPRPDELQPAELPEDTWQRLAIAYGLSFRSEDIGEFIPPSAVDAAPIGTKVGGIDLITKDQV